MPNQSRLLPDRPDASSALQRGRACFERQEWNDAFEALSLADKSQSLEAEDLLLLSWSAGLSARDDAMLATQERVYRAFLAAGQDLAAARAAFWLGFRLLSLGEPSGASGWLSRAQRLVEQHSGDCVEHGYLLLPAAQRHLSASNFAGSMECAGRALEVGVRFAEPDLMAFARNLLGRTCLAEGHVDRGLEFLDEAMVAAVAGELTPVVTGIVYCTSIVSCDRVFALERVREWTAALSTWVAGQPQLGLFNGHCMVHRAEVMQMNGHWPEAADEARRAVVRCVRNIEREAAGRAHYQQAEIHRLRGAFVEADAAYLEASRAGFEPQPGLALLRLAQGDTAAAANASQRIVAATRDRLGRLRFLPAHVEILLAAGDIEAARAASQELQQTAESLGTEVVAAIAAHAQASIELALENPGAALEPARRAFRFWQKTGAPYLAARLRVSLGRACTALGDAEGAALEFQCARETFEKLGAQPDIAALDALLDRTGTAIAGLTERELQVLRLLATGMTNKAIARELSLSEKTIERHLSNIFVKVGVPTRAAATAFAYEQKLV
jgi:DNA-binding CsgD family transcriptional regulator